MREESVLQQFRPIINRIVRTAFCNSPVVDQDDLIQVASLAAVRAVQRYDASAGATLRSYVAQAIRRAVYEEASHFSGPFTLSKGTLSQAAKVRKLESSGKTEADIAASTGLDIVEVNDLLSLYRIRSVSLDTAREELLV